MSVNVLRELEELRSMLDTPKKVYVPGSRIEEPKQTSFRTPAAATAAGVSYDASPPGPSSAGATLRKDYGYALNSAERSVDRLGRAIEAAEEEMEAALRRTTEVHRSQLRQKEVELAELQRLMSARERSVESLRDTLATTKRSYEGRLAQAESALAIRDTEVSTLQEELRVARVELESLQQQARHDLTSQAREIQELRDQEREMQASSRAQGEEAVRLAAQLRAAREERRSALLDADEARRQMELMAEELRAVKQGAAEVQEACKSEISDLKRRLRGERSIRKACEKWLRSELRSREEYDMLLRAIRETAHSSNTDGGGSAGKALGLGLGSLSSPLDAIINSTREVQDVEVLLQKLKASAGVSSPPHGATDDEEVNGPPATGRAARYDSSARAAAAYEMAAASPSRRMATAAAAAAAMPSSLLVPEAELARRRVEEDNRRLQAELLAARRLLQEQRVRQLL